LWLEIPVEDPIGVQENQGLKNLKEETLALLWRESLSHFLHVFFEIEFKVLEHQIKLLLRKQYFFKSTSK